MSESLLELYVRLLVAGIEMWLIMALIISAHFTLRIGLAEPNGYPARLCNNLRVSFMFPLLILGLDPRESNGGQMIASTATFVLAILPVLGAVFYSV